MQVWEAEGLTEKLTLCGEPSGVGVAYETTKKFNIWNKTLFTANFSNEEKIITSSMMSGGYNIIYYLLGIR